MIWCQIGISPPANWDCGFVWISYVTYFRVAPIVVTMFQRAWKVDNPLVYLLFAGLSFKNNVFMNIFEQDFINITRLLTHGVLSVNKSN